MANNQKEEQISRSPQAIASRLRALQAEERMAQKQGITGAISSAEKAKKDIKKLQTIYRVINGTAAITVVGLIVTFVIMNAQLFFGNLLKLKFMPPLEMIEKMIIVPLDIIMILILFVFVILICLATGLI